jgi:hypothetical protein
MRPVNDRFAALRDATQSALLSGPASTPPELRQAVANGVPPEELLTLVRKVRLCAYTVTDDDLDALRSRYREDQLSEIIVAAAFGAAHERLTALRRALDSV